MARRTRMLPLIALVACATDLRDDPEATSANPTAEGGTSLADPTTTGSPPGGESSTAVGESTDAAESTESSPSESTAAESSSTGEEESWPAVACAPGNDLVWVLDRDPTNDGAPRLQRFDPVLVELSPTAPLDCLAAYDFPAGASLAVDRAGMGYLSGAAADVFITLPVVADDPCAAMTTSPWDPAAGLPRLAFRSTDVFDPDHERLFVHVPHNGGGGYGEIFHHLEELTFALYGFSSVVDSRLAGTGDGQLFGTGYDGTLHTIDAINGGELPIVGAPHVAGFAIAAYDGAIYVFQDEPDDEQSEQVGGIFRFALDGSQTYELLVSFDDLPPLDVLDATSSTCAPTPFG